MKTIYQNVITWLLALRLYVIHFPFFFLAFSKWARIRKDAEYSKNKIRVVFLHLSSLILGEGSFGGKETPVHMQPLEH